MMKKKVKKIPKYNVGGSVLDTLKNNNALKGNPITFNPAGYTNNNSTNNFSKFSNWKGTSANPWKDMTSAQKTGAVIDTVGAIGQGLGVATSGQDVNVGTALSTAAGMAGAGMIIGGPIGAAIGAGVGTIMGTAGRKAGYDADSSSTNFNDIYDPGSGLLGLLSDKDKAQRKANIVQNSNISKIQSENIKEMYYSDPNVTLQPTTAAEGGIMRQPVDALVSKGELIYNPMTKKLSKVPGSKGKPNKADDVYARLYEGDVVISNSPTMLMANGKTPAQNLEGLVDRKPREQEIHTDGFRARTPRMYKSDTLGAREAIIKKVVNWQEANKTKPQEYAKFDEGIGNVQSANDVSWDKDMYAQMLSMLSMINRFNFEKYNKMQNDYATLGFDDIKPGNNLKKSDKVATYQKLYDELTLGNERIDQMRKEGRIKGKGGSADKAKTWNDGLPGTQTWLRHLGKNLSEKQMSEINSLLSLQGLEAFINDNGMVNYRKLDKPVSSIETTPVIQIEDEIIDEAPIPDYEKWVQDPQGQYKKGMRKLKLQKIKNSLGGLGETISDFAPLASALFGDYDYHTESSQISPAKYIPTGVSIEPMRRAANESYAMARYNQANISPNTGAGMAYGLQAASNRAKTLADAYTWQQDAQNKLIAQNVGIYNDWRKQRDAYATQAIADTRANEGAAQQMRDSAIRDAYEFVAGRRNDKMRLAMMEPLAKYAFDDDTYKKIYSRAIV